MVNNKGWHHNMGGFKTKQALVGTRHVDKLVKVQRLSGQQDWIFIHVEVQVSREAKFAERMFVYHYRIFDRYAKPVASMAVLGDDDANWLPKKYTHQALDCELDFRFPVAKLARFAGREAQLETNANPFALLTLAYLHTRATRRDMPRRYEVKCQLVRLLHAHQCDKNLIRQFFLIIDWMMALPPELELKLSSFIVEIKKGQDMEYISSIERVRTAQAVEMAKQEGLQTGELTALTRLLTRRFGALPSALSMRLQSATQAQIETWLDRILDANSLDDVFEEMAY